MNAAESGHCQSQYVVFIIEWFVYLPFLLWPLFMCIYLFVPPVPVIWFWENKELELKKNQENIITMHSLSKQHDHKQNTKHSHNIVKIDHKWHYLQNAAIALKGKNKQNDVLTRSQNSMKCYITNHRIVCDVIPDHIIVWDVI